MVASVCSSEGKTIIVENEKEFLQKSVIVVEEESLSDQSWETTSVYSVKSERRQYYQKDGQKINIIEERVYEIDYINQMKEL